MNDVGLTRDVISSTHDNHEYGPVTNSRHPNQHEPKDVTRIINRSESLRETHTLVQPEHGHNDSD